MFQKTADYLYGELTATHEDYKLLENMNQTTISKYSEMKKIASSVSKTMIELNGKCKDYALYLFIIYNNCNLIDLYLCTIEHSRMT